MTEENNFEEPLQNNTQELFKNNIPESYQNNIPEPYQNNIPEPYQNNIPGSNQNNIPGSSQNNIAGPNQNNPNQNNLNQGIINEELNKKMKDKKSSFLTSMIVIFISDMVVEFIALSALDEPSKRSSEGSNFGEGFEILLYLFIVLPALILFSSLILCMSCQYNNPDSKICGSIFLCLIRGLIMISFLSKKKAVIYGITLEILNLILMIISISYQIVIKINMSS